MPARAAWRPARLAATRDLAPDIRLLEIVPEGGFAPPAPGSHLDVAVQVAGRPDVRSYSVVGPARDGRLRVAVKRARPGRGGSAYLWGLAPGARLQVSLADNLFALNRGGGEKLLVAGGIGITPLYGMALALHEAGRPFRLLYAARDRADLVLAEELTDAIGARLETFVSAEGRRVDLAAAIDGLDPAGELYLCGPMPMLEAARRLWRARGRPMERLRFETFGSSGRYAAEPFVVRIPRLSREIRVEAGESMLDALGAAGVAMIHDCRRGECGLCALKILSVEGVVDHRDVFFSDEEKAENGKLCTCVSRVVGGGITVDTADREAPIGAPR